MTLADTGRRCVLLCVLVSGLVAVAGTALAGPARPDDQSALSGRTASPSCSREVYLGSHHYRYGRLPRGSVKAGAMLAERGRLQCEPELVCRANDSCALATGKLVRSDVVRRIRGVSVSLALIDARSGGIYFNRAVFSAALDPRHLLEQLRRRGGPRPGGPQSPPNSYLPATGNAKVRLAQGNYCWSSATGNDQFVTGCATLIAPSMRFDLPLVAAEPGAVVGIHLGVANPTHLQATLFNGDGAILYTQSLTPSQNATWVIPDHLPKRAYLEFEVGRKLAQGAPDDTAAYLARLHSLPSP
jgi:hypothetical protein